MRGRLIVFEGLDSVGKKTQTNLLQKKLGNVSVYHFPAYETKFGRLIREYLKGLKRLPTEAIALLYALDRYQFKEELEAKLSKGEFVICDRYTPSNIFQAAKVEDKLKFWNWVCAVEARLPQPDAIIFLDVEPEIAQELLKSRSEVDIHEADIEYQKSVRKLYLEIAQKEGWIVINCCKNKTMRTPEDIHEEILIELRKRGLV